MNTSPPTGAEIATATARAILHRPSGGSPSSPPQDEWPDWLPPLVDTIAELLSASTTATFVNLLTIDRPPRTAHDDVAYQINVGWDGGDGIACLDTLYFVGAAVDAEQVVHDVVDANDDVCLTSLPAARPSVWDGTGLLPVDDAATRGRFMAAAGDAVLTSQAAFANVVIVDIQIVP